MLPSPLWCPVSGMGALRQLVIDNRRLKMEYATFRLLCSLPLTHLSLAIDEVSAAGAAGRVLMEGDKVEAGMPPVTGTWQWFRLLWWEVVVDLRTWWKRRRGSSHHRG